MRVDKPWGYELHWAKTERYVGKIIHVDAGHALSLQYHRVKDETILVWSGRIRFETGRGDSRVTREMGPGERVHIAPGTVHRMTALEAADVFEVSTPELDDVVRLEDRYGRVAADDGRPPAAEPESALHRRGPVRPRAPAGRTT